MSIGDSVIVGIDGSVAAIDTAQWAAREAIMRDVPLKLVSAVNTARTPGHRGPTGHEVENGEEFLSAAAAAVYAMAEPVKVETEVVWGPPAEALIEQSRTAALLCVGTVGIGAFARAVIGSTASGVAGRARCSVAVIRPRETHSAANFVAVGIDDRPETDAVIESALREARARRAPLVAAALGCNVFGGNSEDRVEHRLEPWRQGYPDVAIDVREAQANLSDFLADHCDDLRRRYTPSHLDGDPFARPLAVLDSADIHAVANIVGPHDHAVLRHGYCSVLVIR